MSKKATLTFDFESSLDGSDEVTAQSQSLHALRIIGLFQIGYVIMGYATSIITQVSESEGISDGILQAPGGISILSAVAAVLIRLDCSPQQSKSQLLIYMALVVLDLVGWLLRLILTFRSIAITSYIATLTPFIFILILSIMGILEARTLKSLVETTRYAPLSVSPSDDEKRLDRTFTELCYYPMRKFIILQVAYCVVVCYSRVIASSLQSDGLLSFLVTPGAAVLTIVASVAVYSYCAPLHQLNLAYIIMIGVDGLFGLIRLAIGFIMSSDFKLNMSPNVYFITAVLWSIFIYYIWGMGIYQMLKVRRHIVESSVYADSSHVDHIFSL